MIDKSRYIVHKIYVNEHEDAAIRKHCGRLGRTISAAGRELLLSSQTPAHRKRYRRPREGPISGPSFADMFPGRRGGAPIPMRI
jgi:hypothetical protein